MIGAMKTPFKSLARILILALAVAFTANYAFAQITTPPGWVVLSSQHSFKMLASRVQSAARDQQLGIVSRASATVGAKKVLGMDIPGNMVIGLYHPRFAVRMLNASVAAGIEAPIRVYVTENNDGTATLSYKTPSAVFAPYMDEGGKELKNLATELDQLFSALTKQAVAR